MPDHAELLPIGELSRRSGLTVSALRFYDREGLLRPADVDSFTGYRRYRPDQVRDARLLAGLRRVQVPMAEMAEVLEHRHDTAAVRDLLQGHVHRLEAGVRAARLEVERLCSLLDAPAAGSARVDAALLRSALEDVRYAVSRDPDLPALRGVRLDLADDLLTVVATDRYRLALARLDVAGGPGGAGVLLPADELDDLLTWLGRRDGDVALELAEEALVLTDGQEEHRVAGSPHAFPDHRQVLEARPQGERRPLTDLTADLTDGEEAPVSLAGHVRVDRAFLLEAIGGVGGHGEVVLPLDGQIGPLLLADPEESRLVLLMPLAPVQP